MLSCKEVQTLNWLVAGILQHLQGLLCSTRLGKAVPVKLATLGTFLGILESSIVWWRTLQLSVCFQGTWSVLQLPWVHWIAAECAKPWQGELLENGVLVLSFCHVTYLPSGRKKNPVTMLSRHNTTLGMSSCFIHMSFTVAEGPSFGMLGCYRPKFLSSSKSGAGRFQSPASQVYDHAICECSINAPLEVQPSVDWFHLLHRLVWFFRIELQNLMVWTDKFIWSVVYIHMHLLPLSRLYTWYR